MKEKDAIADRKDVEYVRKLFPELRVVKERELTEKTCVAWAYAWRKSGYQRIEDIPYEPYVPGINNIDHTRVVTKVAIELVNIMKESGVKLNMDHVVVGSICHDLGKPFEWRPHKRGLFRIEFGSGCFYPEGNPNVVRHPVISAHIAILVGLPEEVVHIVTSHAAEGELWRRTPEAMAVHLADECYELVLMEKLGHHYYKVSKGAEIPRWDVR